MFDNLFVHMGPWASSLALLLVVMVPALLVAGETLQRAGALERMLRIGECLATRWPRR